MATTKTSASRRRRRRIDEIKAAGLTPGATSLRTEFAVECIDIEAASEVEGAVWEPFQLVLLNDVSTLSNWVKSRQVAWSFTVAAEAWIEAFLYSQSSIFVSINREEAREKINYARRLYFATRGVRMPKIIRDNEFSLGFDNGATLESLPSRPPRGKARRNVYLDEFAHVQHDRDIYRGAFPVISKGGRLRMGSSPMGATGLFWEIATETLKAYPGYSRFTIPWWEVQHFCTNVKKAGRAAPKMLTGERVDRFGSDVLKLIFENTVLEDFQQEYEATFVDEVASWVTWEEIGRCQDEDLLCLMGEFRQRDVAAAKQLIDKLAGLVATQEVEYAFAGGVDIGRTRNTTEIYFGGATTADRFPLRLAITLDGVEFEQQKHVISYAIETLPVHTVLIDRNGLGMNIAEDLEKSYPAVAYGFDFTNPNKKVLATDLKKLFQQGKAVIPPDRDLAYQVHSIRRKVSATGMFVFDTESAAKHHADKFWSLALMLHALDGNRTQAGTASIITLR